MEALDAFRRFTLSIDIVNDSVKEDVSNILKNISINVLGASFFGVKVPGLPNDKNEIKYLRTIWSDKTPTSTRIKNDKGEYNGQGAFAFDNNLKLWVTNENKGKLLRSEDKCIDHWSKTKNLPPYWEYLTDVEYKTSIIVPLTFEGSHSPLGVVTFEFSEYIEFSKSNKLIFESLSESIAILVHLNRTRNNQLKNTRRAVEEIKTLATQNLGIIKKPKVFVAFPIKCKKDVLKVIKKIESNNDNYDFIWWDDINSSGNIDRQLIDKVLDSRFGIVYFSQWDEHQHNFFDNPNVVFEAGMFHALSNRKNIHMPVNWIPIREKDSGEKPFDFAHERIIVVKRKPDKTLNIADLELRIQERLDEFK
ncbi:GAF domain-containing protein [uncultured Aquimarina sp.]|uniref:GAF domain-containing protein n=1 Tax=uncultured Aquimarina sp. TaxID=575652 RepID=UPI00260518E2|nr:GAF domain-containing protein [uncultured Aquimarina sp.]